MSCAIMRNTFKTLVRMWTFWLIVLVSAAIAVRLGYTEYVSYAPGYEPSVLSYESYVQGIYHRLSQLLLIASPFLVIVTTVLITNRDYGDQFFEVEKAAGVKPANYLFGRLSVIAIAAVAVQWVISFLCVFVFVIRKGGVYGLSVWQYCSDSAWRLFRVDIFVAFPMILFYLGLTYLLGIVFRSGIAAALGGLGLSVANFSFTILYQYRSFQTFFNYFAPPPKMLLRYVIYYQAENSGMQLMGATFERASLSAGFLISFFAVCAICCYFLIKKRES